MKIVGTPSTNIRYKVEVAEYTFISYEGSPSIYVWRHGEPQYVIERYNAILALMLEVSDLRSQLNKKPMAASPTHRILLRDFTLDPGPRYRVYGPNSGEEWAESVLVPGYLSAKASNCPLIVELDGPPGIGFGFLHQAFLLLGRAGATKDDVIVRCRSEPELIYEAISALIEGSV